MPQAKLFFEQEWTVILAHRSQSKTPTGTAELLKRHVTIVRRYLQNPKPVASPRDHNPNQKLSDRYIRYIHQLTIITKKSAVELQKDVPLQVSVRIEQESLRETPHLKYK